MDLAMDDTVVFQLAKLLGQQRSLMLGILRRGSRSGRLDPAAKTKWGPCPEFSAYHAWPLLSLRPYDTKCPNKIQLVHIRA